MYARACQSSPWIGRDDPLTAHTIFTPFPSNTPNINKQEYKDFPEILPFIAATPAAAILERPVVDRAPVPKWGFMDGRVLLIGDAVRVYSFAWENGGVVIALDYGD